MKTTSKYLGVFVASVLIISCSEDDDIPVPGNGNPPPGENYIVVDFEPDFSILENEGAKEVKLLFDRSARSSGEIKLKLHAQEGLAFSSVPAASDGYVTLTIEKDDEWVSFQLIPENDDIIKGDKVMSIMFSNLSEGLQKADNNGLEIIIKDDELMGKPKSFSNGALKTEYFYREDGRVSSVKYSYQDDWTSTDQYHYSTAGQVIKVESDTNYGDYLVNYHWDNERIISSEVIEAGEKTVYAVYDYDTAGNIGGKSVHHKQDSGEFIETMVFIYLYFEDGNLYKQLTYIPVKTEEEFELISIRTYEHYIDRENIFPVNQVIPGIVTQKNLPASYRIEENGFDLKYDFTYYYDEEGRMIRRETSGETVTYTYY